MLGRLSGGERLAGETFYATCVVVTCAVGAPSQVPRAIYFVFCVLRFTLRLVILIAFRSNPIKIPHTSHSASRITIHDQLRSSQMRVSHCNNESALKALPVINATILLAC